MLSAVATINSYMGHLSEWYDTHIMPAVEEIYREDEAACRARIAQAWEQLRNDPALSDEERQAMEYELIFFDHLIVNRMQGDAAQAAQFKITYPALRDLAPIGPLAAACRAACLICMLGLGVRRGFITMSEAEVDELVAAIPEDRMPSNLWYYLIAWAYLNDNLKYLEQALADLTVGATGWVDDYYWLRTNLMYQLVTRKASRLDVEKTISGYQHPHHIADFRNLFLKRCEAAGLMDAELHALLEQKEQELEALRGTVPASKPKTGGIVRRP